MKKNIFILFDTLILDIITVNVKCLLDLWHSDWNSKILSKLQMLFLVLKKSMAYITFTYFAEFIHEKCRFVCTRETLKFTHVSFFMEHSLWF